MREGEALRALIEGADAVAKVTVDRVEGSAPRDTGAWMLVTPTALFQTIGGGALEHRAVAAARAMLSEGGDRLSLAMPLGPEIGQCCGGRVTLSISRLGSTERAALIAEHGAALASRPAVFVFGAGHVGLALSRALALLPLCPVLIDSREAMLAEAPEGVETILTPLPEAVVRDAPAGAAFVVMTHDHATDFLITREALARGDAAYVGLIGSQTKRGAFAGWLRRAGDGDLDTSALICPVGGRGIGDKRPSVIASFVAAEVMARLSLDTATRHAQPSATGTIRHAVRR
ncbi:MAG: xanthine dehydrogenase accessory protein XdhC [Pseudomonadota bacterium]